MAPNRLPALALLGILTLALAARGAAAWPTGILGCDPVAQTLYDFANCQVHREVNDTVGLTGWAVNYLTCVWLGGPFCDGDYARHLCDDWGLCGL